MNSAKEFQTVTQVSDSLLNQSSPYFKFPDWVTTNQSIIKKKTYNRERNQGEGYQLGFCRRVEINLWYWGILSERVTKFRDRLGGFLVKEQLYDVYGLKTDVGKKCCFGFRFWRFHRYKK